MVTFPSLDGFGPTRATLHSYARAINGITRVYALQRPHWWHISLKLTDHGLITDPLPLPSGGSAVLRLNFQEHQVELDDGTGTLRVFSMRQGWTGTQMSEALVAAVADLGLEGKAKVRKDETDEPVQYDPDAVGNFFTALQSTQRVFEEHVAALAGDISAIQLWPHNFDMSVEWYGTKMIPYEEKGTTTLLPAQLNLGFYPGENNRDSYFYSNPWPFETDLLLGQSLAAGATWHTEGWQGTELPYALVAEQPDAEQRVLEYARAVYALTSPTLLA